MAEAARQAQTSTQPTWILALDQTKARGRRGRAWVHPKGNFAATLVMDAGEIRTAALRSFVASLALFDSFEALGVRGLSLKWPNDVLLHGGKVAGILLEGLPHGRLAIGIGVNLAHAPGTDQVEAGAVPPVTLGIKTTPEEMLDVLAPSFAEWEARFLTYGFEPIRETWLSRAAKLGMPITARTTHQIYHGTFETVDTDGQLVLSTAKDRLTIPAADVYF